MNTLHFKYAVEIAKTGSITQAADNLYMSQPNLSKAVKELEETLGISIFKRTSKGVVPTESGAEFLIYAKNILSQIDHMMQLNSPDDPGLRKFSISAARAGYILDGILRFISGFGKDGDMAVDFVQTSSMRTIEDVSEGRYKLGVIRYHTEHEQYFSDYLKSKSLAGVSVWDFENVVIASSAHPALSDDRDELSLKELDAYPEIVYGDMNVPYISPQEGTERPIAAARRGKTLVYDRCDMLEMLSEYTLSYTFSSPIPEKELERYRLKEKKAPQAGSGRDMLIYRNDYQLSELDKAFLGKLYEARNDVAFKADR